MILQLILWISLLVMCMVTLRMDYSWTYNEVIELVYISISITTIMYMDNLYYDYMEHRQPLLRV